ncbi:hypothetical protein CWI36_2155p0010 [Hamiltosporidium magnivora]|uniref:Uncharacterized protein n=1 Tax=Hamiltosporidium magnivora TaxID=148818 RepID=A0A4V2JU64_9MICR|nr:hypothetical protein CWI36_2155p0010 [Hamiltosporidium magnivora]
MKIFYLIRVFCSVSFSLLLRNKRNIHLRGVDYSQNCLSTNDACYETNATLLEGIGVYLYLGIIEVPEILDNEYAKVRMDIRIKTYVKIQNNSPEIFILELEDHKYVFSNGTINENEKLNLEEGGEVVNTVEKNI